MILSNKEVLGLTLIGEARGEPIESQVAVACVIRNRLHNNPNKYHSYNDVCLEHSQFSCWNIDDPNRALLDKLSMGLDKINDSHLSQCMFVAQGIVDCYIIDNTNGATNYLTTSLFKSGKIAWAKKATNIKQIGNQTYFNV